MANIPHHAQGGKRPTFYVPRNLDLNLYPAHIRGPLAYMTNTIHWRTCCWRADAEGYVRLKWEYLTRIIPRRVWRELLVQYLWGGGPHGDFAKFPRVVDCDEYRDKVKARGYRLRPEFRDVMRSECADPVLAKRIIEVTTADERPLLPVHRWLRRWVDALTLDLHAALSEVARSFPDEETPRWLWRDGKMVWREPPTVEDYRAIIAGQVHRIANGDLWLTCDRYGRVHTPLTSLPRQLRPHIRLNGERMVGLDVVSSQPLLLGLLTQQFSNGSKISQSRMMRRDFTPTTSSSNPYAAWMQHITHKPTNKPTTTTHNNPTPYYGCAPLPKSMPGMGLANVAAVTTPGLIGVCEGGQFYENFMGEGEDRAAFKVRFFRDVLFGSNSVRSPVRTAFQRRYREEEAVLVKLRSREHARAAWLLQSLESTIFIRQICGTLMEEAPDLPLLTLHDGLYTTATHIDHIREVTLEEFARWGVCPKLKIEWL